MPFPLFRRSKAKEKSIPKGDSSKKILNVLDDVDGELKAISAETNLLLQRSTPVSPSRKRPRKIVGRVTIEVLDTFPVSARPNEENSNVQIKVPGENLVDIPRLTPLLVGDAFGFEEEEKRVRGAADTFIPSTLADKKILETQIATLSLEKERLQHNPVTLLHSLPAPEVDYDAPQVYRGQDTEIEAAIRIQAAARGRLARRRYKKKKKTEKEQTEPLWREISDPERGETWYYNVKTGQSQWEPPSTFPPLNKSSKNAKNLLSLNNQTSLPLLSSATTSQPKQNLGTSNNSMPSPRQMLPAINKESILLQDCEDDIMSMPSIHQQTHVSTADAEMVDWMDDTALFLADGSKNTKLRNTIRDALKVSKFDSVSALLTSSISFNAKREKYRRPDVQSPSSPTNIPTREVALGKKADTYMVAVLAKDQGSKGKKKTQQKTKERLRIRDLADDGFLLDQTNAEARKSPLRSAESKPNETMQCFACWSAIKGCLCEEHQDPYDNKPRPASESALMCSNWEIDQLRRKYRAEEIQEIFMKANSSLRYDKQRKAYITIIECRHPIYRNVEAVLTSFNKTMRRKLHTRGWFRSFLEQLRLGSVSHSPSPSILKMRDTLRNNKWCQSYSDSVTNFHPKAPLTLKSFSPEPTLEIIAINPNASDLRHWILKTVCPIPIVLYQPRKYELVPRRCIPMPQPSFLDQIPLPVPNRYINGCDKISWVERLCARMSQASLYRAISQVNACTPPVGFDKPRRTRLTPPCCVLFANFGRKPSPGNLAVGGLIAELLIYLVVTTFVPPQFGNLTVTDRRAICPKTTVDHYANYLCLEIGPTAMLYVIRPLEHALNTRRPPTIMICVEGDEYEDCLNRPEQTGEDAYFGFRTILVWVGLSSPEEIQPVTFVPSGDVLTFNIPASNATVTTRADRYYPFCEPTTRESAIAEFIHLLWMGKSSRNQSQCFTNLGSQDPGDFMKNCNVDGAMGPCTPVIYRSWAFMQTSPFEEFVTDDGIAYWYDKRTGATYWERPLLEQEKHRGEDGDVEGVVIDGKGEKASIGVGAAEARYSQHDMRKYMTKTIESTAERESRMKSFRNSSAKHSIVLKPEELVVPEPPPPRISRIKVPPLPKLPILSKNTELLDTGTQQHIQTQKAPDTCSSPTKQNVKHSGSTPSVNPETKKLIETLTHALGHSMSQTNMIDVLQLGIGLGMGIGMKSSSLLAEESPSELSSENSARSEGASPQMLQDDAMTATTRTERSLALDFTPDELPPEEAVVHPFGTEYVTHPPPGEGESWVDKPSDFSEESQTAVDGFRGAIHKSVAVLPRNFVECASTPKTVKMEANYLPSILNKNQPRCMGIVRPRTAADEWLTIGYDPWVAGKELFNSEFVHSLSLEEDDKPPIAGASFIDTNEHAARQEVVSQAAKEAMELEHLFSLCRHGKYAEVENILNQPDWTISIDAKDNAGNTLLSVACQNNNKRIAKLCLRKGADVNTQNLNGQTILHYTHAYGFHDLMEYLMEKGAKDDILNKDNLTCYEGLSSEAVEAI